MGNAQQNQQTASLAHRHEQTKRSKSEHRTRGSNNQGMLKSLMCVSAAPPRKLQPKPQSSLRINNEWFTYAKQQFDLMSEESRYILAVKECFINKFDLKACAVQQSQISKMYSQIMWEEGNPEKLVKRIYAEIKLQMKRSDNPVQIINKAFRHYFTLNYRGFVLKMQGNNSDKALQVSELCSKISRETQKLRSESSSQSGSTAADSNEDDNDVRFSDKVMGDVKRMIAVLLFTSFKFYHISPVLSENGQQMFDILKDKLIQLLTKQVLCKNVYKITLTVCREETMQQEKQLRLQYKRLAMRQISTYDLDINPYFLLNEQSPIFTFMNDSLQSMLSQSMTQAQQMRIFEMQLDQQLITEEDESFALTQSESRISNENFSDSGDDEPHAFRKTNAGVTKRSNQVEDGQVAQKVAEEDDPNDPLRYDSKALQDYLQNELATIKDITDQFKASKIDIEERLRVKPYARVVNKLRELRLYENPIKKVKQIMKARDLIPICINEFWRGIEIPNDKLVLDADQMLSIMTYAISQSAMADLSCHLRLIQEFTSTDLQNSKMGQALFTVRAALENFCDGVKIAHIQNQYIMQAGSSGSIRAARSCLSSTLGETSASTSTVTISSRMRAASFHTLTLTQQGLSSTHHFIVHKILSIFESFAHRDSISKFGSRQLSNGSIAKRQSSGLSRFAIQLFKNSKEFDSKNPDFLKYQKLSDSFKLPQCDQLLLCREGTMLSSIVDPFLTELNEYLYIFILYDHLIIIEIIICNEEDWEASFDVDGKDQSNIQARHRRSYLFSNDELVQPAISATLNPASGQAEIKQFKIRNFTCSLGVPQGY